MRNPGWPDVPITVGWSGDRSGHAPHGQVHRSRARGDSGASVVHAAHTCTGVRDNGWRSSAQLHASTGGYDSGTSGTTVIPRGPCTTAAASLGNRTPLLKRRLCVASSLQHTEASACYNLGLRRKIVARASAGKDSVIERIRRDHRPDQRLQSFRKSLLSPSLNAAIRARLAASGS